VKTMQYSYNIMSHPRLELVNNKRVLFPALLTVLLHPGLEVRTVGFAQAVSTSIFRYTDYTRTSQPQLQYFGSQSQLNLTFKNIRHHKEHGLELGAL
jgi:hypothetical protein